MFSFVAEMSLRHRCISMLYPSHLSSRFKYPRIVLSAQHDTLSFSGHLKNSISLHRAIFLLSFCLLSTNKFCSERGGGLERATESSYSINQWVHQSMCHAPQHHSDPLLTVGKQWSHPAHLQWPAIAVETPGNWTIKCCQLRPIIWMWLHILWSQEWHCVGKCLLIYFHLTLFVCKNRDENGLGPPLCRSRGRCSLNLSFQAALDRKKEKTIVEGAANLQPAPARGFWRKREAEIVCYHLPM